jgi:tetratricopeptide (TPR) repeat protein
MGDLYYLPSLLTTFARYAKADQSDFSEHTLPAPFSDAVLKLCSSPTSSSAGIASESSDKEKNSSSKKEDETSLTTNNDGNCSSSSDSRSDGDDAKTTTTSQEHQSLEQAQAESWNYLSLRREQNERWASSRLHQGVQLALAKRYDAAEKLYREALALCPTYVDAIVALGALLANTGEHLKSIELLKEALSLDEHHVNAKAYLKKEENVVRNLSSSSSSSGGILVSDIIVSASAMSNGGEKKLSYYASREQQNRSDVEIERMLSAGGSNRDSIQDEKYPMIPEEAILSSSNNPAADIHHHRHTSSSADSPSEKSSRHKRKHSSSKHDKKKKHHHKKDSKDSKHKHSRRDDR